MIDQMLKRLMMVSKAKGVHIEFRLNSLCVRITVAVTFTVCFSEFMRCFEIQRNFKCIEYLGQLHKESLIALTS